MVGFLAEIEVVENERQSVAPHAADSDVKPHILSRAERVDARDLDGETGQLAEAGVAERAGRKVIAVDGLGLQEGRARAAAEEFAADDGRDAPRAVVDRDDLGVDILFDLVEGDSDDVVKDVVVERRDLEDKAEGTLISRGGPNNPIETDKLGV